MSKAIETLRQHFNQKTVPNSKVLMEERDRVNEMIDAVEDENERLRELCKDLYMCTDDTCNDCKHRNLAGEGFYCKLGIGWRARRMRELGIEVDE